MTVESVVDDGNVYLFEDICGDSPFWTPDVLSSEAPKFTACFQTTILQWIPFIWICLALPVYVVVIFRRPPEVRLPLTSFSIAKSVLCLALVILTIAQALSVNRNGPGCEQRNVTSTSYYLGYGLTSVSLVIVGVFIQLVRRWGVISSAVIYAYWILLLVCSIIPLQSTLSYELFCSNSNVVYHIFYFVMILVQTILHSFADKRSSRDYENQQRCPDVDVSSLSNLVYAWMTPTVIKAYKKKIAIYDLWTQSERLKCNNTVSELQLTWNKELRRLINLHRQNKRTKIQTHQNGSSHNGHVMGEETPLLASGSSRKSHHLLEDDESLPLKPSLYRTLIKTYGLLWLQCNLMKVVSDLCLLSQPILIKYIVLYVGNRGKPGYPVWNGVLLAFLFFAASQANTFIYNASLHLVLTLALRVKSALVGTIYRKALKMGNTVKRDYTVGQIVNLMSVDCQRIQDSVIFFNYMIPFVTSLAVSLYEIWDAVNESIVYCLIVAVIFISLNIIFGRFQQRYQIGLMQSKSSRMKLFNEVLGGIKVLKMYAWESIFGKKLLSIREKELGFLRKYAVVTSFTVTLSTQSPFLLSTVVFLGYVLAKPSQYLDAATAFQVVSVVNFLRYPISFVPYVITAIIQSRVSVGRIQQFLWSEDLNTDTVHRVTEAVHAVSVENASFTWDPELPIQTLRSINVNIDDGQLVAVVGLVGAGKSSLLAALLGEMARTQGRVTLKGTTAYVPQEAWIQNMTLKDNILYGSQFRTRRYRKVIKACQLTPDLAILSAGDQTEIGQRGINLSGGQKQRVSLARAVYSNSNVYLLDDPLSAVDSHVGKAIFDKVISHDGLLKGKTRVLVTHGIHWLPKVDKIIVMDNGRITEMGSYDQLLENNGAFSRFLNTYLLKGDSDDDESDEEVRLIKQHIRERFDQVTSDGLTSDDNIVMDELTKGFGHKKSLRRRTISTTSAATVESLMSLSQSSPKCDEEQRFHSGRLITEETTKEGVVSWRVYFGYMKAMGVGATILAVSLLAASQAIGAFLNFWIDFWTTDVEMDQAINVTAQTNSTMDYIQDFTDKNIYYLTTYFIIGLAQGIAMFLFVFLYLFRMVRASKYFHSSMLDCILRSPMSFYDTTPIGRVLNRFSSDLDVIDDRLPRTFRLLLYYFSVLLLTFIVIGIQTPQFLIALAPAGVLFIILLKFYLPTARQLKRIESVTRSPVYNHFGETITGASVIRAYGSVDRFIQESERRVDTNLAFYHGANGASRWIGIASESLSNTLVLVAALFTVLSPTVTGSDAGLSLTYASQIVFGIAVCVYSVSEMEMNIVSAERVSEYTELPAEAEWDNPAHHPHDSWPDDGTVKFKNYTTRYRPGLELVLNGVNCEIHSGEKVGIVGRTGAGKSSLVLALFRLTEAASGSITIDQRRIADLGLHDLRPRITILPQDPVIFSDSIRANLDPSNRFSDEAVWRALESAHLKQYVSGQQNNIYHECGEGGLNLSAGQRQLVCLGRALLHKNKILILDEATAAVDMETDDLIQQTIKMEFEECTVLTIAHRLNTIMDYDRVMVLDKGLIVEFDRPQTLLTDKDTVFYSMAKDADLVDWFDTENKLR
ncbi:multidrug resistance-associated protein 1-like [Mizuhopecten yessoensis]|uniref:ABC-type glutathione-S-conjugate transporter n=1 Tax=Mizuhopecten yessoensis TaxID=6573 RepID=A0A210R3H5_MIZYE|nr:multidrug resistance-associated protein 1-like [Mizuhopecten yessoensis]OWF55505.1 Multidrug resistance-associated protein 1 [Mizuhopecten yessoensis]